MSFKEPTATGSEPGLITLTGDLGGTATSPTVIALQGNAIQSGILGAIQDGYALIWTNGSSQWQARSVPTILSDGQDYQFSNTSSDVSGYDQLLNVASGSQGDLSTAVTSGGGKTLIKAFASTITSPGVAVIPAGLWEFNYYGYASLTGAFNTQLIFDVYTRTSGGAETLVFSITGPNLNVTSIGPFTVSFNQTADVYIADTTRVVIKVSAQTSNITSVTAHFVFDGNTSISLVRTPIAGDAIQLGGDLSGTTNSATVNSISGSSPITITPANLQWVTGASSPTINQADNTTNSATATNIIIQAQNATGTSATGGSITLTSGTGTTIAGNINIETGGTNRISVSPTALTFITSSYAVSSNSLTWTDISALTFSGVTISVQTDSFHYKKHDGTDVALFSSNSGSDLLITLETGNNLEFFVNSETGWTRAGHKYATITWDGSNGVIFDSGAATTVALGTVNANAISIGGTSAPITLLGPTLKYNATVSSPTFNQAQQANGSNPNNLTIAPQAPGAGAASTPTGTPGSLIVSLAAPVSTGTAPYLQVLDSQSNHGNVFMGPLSASNGGFAGVWFGNVTPNSGNYNIACNGGTLDMSGSTSLNLFGGAAELTLTSTTLAMAVPTVQFTTGISSPTINQANASSASGQNLAVTAQAGNGSGNNGGNLLLNGGASGGGSGIAGQVQITSPIQLQTNVLNDATASSTTTTDGSLTTIYTDSAIPASTVYDFVVTVVGINTSTQDVYRADFSFTYSRVGSAAPLAVGAAAAALNVRTSLAANTWGGASIALSTNSVIVQVTGLAATTIHWVCSFNRLKVI